MRLHDYNIAQKVQIVVEHFRENVAPLLNNQAKAMVVVASRKEAVRWQLAIQKYIKEQGYPIGTLVAFSGEVQDKELGEEEFTENSKVLNPNLRGRDIREAFATDEYQILLVANKFQTGFDQPLLCGMYVDKRLAGIQAVQTLSRLNRSYEKNGVKKDTTYILDFINEPEEILTAFKAYHTTAELENVTDPNLVYNLRAKLDSAGYYDDFEVDRVVAVELNPTARQSELISALEPVADRLLKKYKQAQSHLVAAKARDDADAIQDAQNELNALMLFKSDMAGYQRMYSFLSQIFDYGNTAVEKRAIFYKRLLPLLEFGREREGIDLSKVVLTHHSLRNQGKRTLSLNEGDGIKLQPLTEAGSGSVHEKEKALLAELIDNLNDIFGGELSDSDQVKANDMLVCMNHLKGKMLESEILRQQAANNTKEQFWNSPDLKQELLYASMDADAAYQAISRIVLNSEKVRNQLLQVLLGPGQLYESLQSA